MMYFLFLHNFSLFTFPRKGNIAPGGELRTIEDYISLGVPRVIAEMKHPLEHAWTFWYFRNDKSRSWEENQINLATVDTIEDFWQIYNYVEPASKLGLGCDYALFKVTRGCHTVPPY